jgi:hypothetical protein
MRGFIGVTVDAREWKQPEEFQDLRHMLPTETE